MIEIFFEQLAEYYRQENDLSNIVVALCNSNRQFRNRFIRFFFPEIEVDKITSILREVPDAKNLGSRVDIYISITDEPNPYIVEVKIGDRSHHFGQYEVAYEIGKDRFGYITNYECIEGKELGYDVKTWEEFHEHLLESEISDDMIKGFTTYLKNVCGIIKYRKPMNIKGLEAIPCFVNTVKKIIRKNRNWVKTSFYRQYSYESSIHEGFTIHFSEDDYDQGFALFGLWFQEKPIISIIINSRQWLSERILNDKEKVIEDAKYAVLTGQAFALDKYDVWFELNDEKLQQFIEASSYEEQNEILERFFEEVLRSIQKYF